LNDTKYGKKQAKIPMIDIINRDGLMANAFPISMELTKFSEVKLYDDVVDVSDKFSFCFENAGVMREGNIITGKVVEQEETPITLGSILEPCENEDYFVSSSDLPSWVTMKGAKKKERTTADGHKYTFSEGAIPFLDYHNKPGRTMLTSEGTKNRSTHIVADPGTGTIRILTPVECERLQGFDDNWTEGMPDRMRRFCMGNALVVPMVTRMGKVLDKIIENE